MPTDHTYVQDYFFSGLFRNHCQVPQYILIVRFPNPFAFVSHSIPPQSIFSFLRQPMVLWPLDITLNTILIKVMMIH